VLDNLSTHSAGALYQAFPASEARRVLRRLKFTMFLSTPAGWTWGSRCLDPPETGHQAAPV